MSHNESKPYHVRRPFKVIPTKKAVRVLNKLYTSKHGPNLTLSYDIFDPSYSSDHAKGLTKHGYNKLVKSVTHSSGNRKNTHRPTNKNNKKNSMKSHPSDKQQFFLRNTISADSDGETHTTKRQRVAETRADKSYLDKPQHHSRKSQQGSESTKNSDSWKRKLPSAAANNDGEGFDVHKALEDSYEYYMRNRGYGNGQAHKFDGKISTSTPSRSFVKSQDAFELSALSGEPHLRSSVKESTASIYPSSVKDEGSSPGYTASRNMAITSKTPTPETYKEESATARTLQQPAAGMAKLGKDLGNFSFRSLPDIDSGNYTIEQLSDNKVFVTLKSKTGKLQTFYGTTAKPSNAKTDEKGNKNHSSTNDQENINLVNAGTHVAKNTNPSNMRKNFEENANLTKSTKVLALDLAVHKKQKSKKKHKKKAKKSKAKFGERALFYENSRPIQAAYSPRGKEYFQSSLQTAPAGTGSFESRNSKFETSQNGRNFEAAGRRQHTSSTETATTTATATATAATKTSKTAKKDSDSLEKNLHLTAYDVYDNKLAHVDKPISYFTKNVRNRDPNRLIITENKDPYTDSSMVKLFIDSGDETSLLPDDPMGLKSHKKVSASRSMLGSDASDDEFANDVNKLAKLEDTAKDSSTRSLKKIETEAKTGKQGAKNAGGVESSGESKNRKGDKKEPEHSNPNEKTVNDSENSQANKSKQHDVRKIVEVKQGSREQKKENELKKPATERKENSLTNDHKSSKNSNSSSGKERSPETTQKEAKEGKQTGKEKDDVWVFEADSKQLNEQKTVANTEKSVEKHKNKQVRTGGLKALGSSGDGADNGELFAKNEGETAPPAPKGESLIAKMGQAVGKLVKLSSRLVNK